PGERPRVQRPPRRYRPSGSRWARVLSIYRLLWRPVQPPVKERKRFCAVHPVPSEETGHLPALGDAQPSVQILDTGELDVHELVGDKRHAVQVPDFDHEGPGSY